MQKETGQSVMIHQSFTTDSKLSRFHLPLKDIFGVPVLQSADSVTAITSWAEHYYRAGPLFHSIGESSNLFLVTGSNYSGVNRYDMYLFLCCYKKQGAISNPTWLPVWKLVFVEAGAENISANPAIAYGHLDKATMSVTIYDSANRKVKTIDLRNIVKILRQENLDITGD